jgi:chemotaxis protein CheD
MDKIEISIAEYKVSNTICVLETQSLGSCVGVTLFDPVKKIAGLAHVMLPDSKNAQTIDKPGKYANTAIRGMLEEMMSLGAMRHKIVAKIFGGACMFTGATMSSFMNIGARNLEAVKNILTELKIPIVNDDTGLNYGRTIEFNTENGKVTVKAALHPNKEI